MLVDKFQKSHVEFNRRQANRVAHKLAQTALSNPSPHIIDDVPTCIWHILDIEMQWLLSFKKKKIVCSLAEMHNSTEPFKRKRTNELVVDLFIQFYSLSISIWPLYLWMVNVFSASSNSLNKYHVLHSIALLLLLNSFKQWNHINRNSKRCHSNINKRMNILGQRKRLDLQYQIPKNNYFH